MIYKYVDYKSYIINWDALLSEVWSLDELTANPVVPKQSTLSASHMFRNVKKDSQWSIEYRGFRGATAKTVVCVAVPK